MPKRVAARAHLLGWLLLVLWTNAWAASAGIVTARDHTWTDQVTAYAHVASIAIVTLRAAQPGQVQKLNVDPGQHVAANAPLGVLSGPEVEALLAERRAAVAGAQAAVTASRQILQIQRQRRASHLGTRQALDNARSAQTQAKARLSSAQTALRTARDNAILRAPDSGTIIALAASDGERVSPGQVILTLQPDHGLWIKAVYYGAHARTLHIGLVGRFVPADGSAPIAVRVARVLPVEQPGGGLAVGLRAQNASVSWRSGEAGTVTLGGAHKTGVVVPTRALILYQSHWWVLIKTPKGDRRQRVTPGPGRGGDTLITQGLAAGAQVVVDDAYLKFHRDFSQHYQPPD